MKNVVVFYSMSGNSEFVARELSLSLGADLLEVKPEKAYPSKGPTKFLVGGKSALAKDEPRLVPYEFDAEKYGRVIFVSPVWASTFAPPVRTFISENRASLAGKRFAAVVCCKGGGGDAALEKLKEALAIDSFDAALVLVEPKMRPSGLKVSEIKRFAESLA